MAETKTEIDNDALTLTVTTRFDASVERVWQLWADPRQLERWWGPPTFPATFDQHDLTVGGRSLYYMTGPEGEQHWGWWVVTLVDAPNRLELDDGFADADGTPSTTIEPTHQSITLTAIGDATEMTMLSSFTSQEQLSQMLEMGMEEGLSLALGQIDAILAE